ncbi:MAG: hypothetical protein Q7R86_02940 [bacterium]|nr:hypothetical protein [bacterium]
MLVRIILDMDDPVVHGEHFDCVTIDFTENATREDVMRFSQKWSTGRNFLTSRMNGLSEVGKSALTIEKVEVDASYKD